MNSTLLLILVIQAGLMLAGLGFLVQTRHVITPRSVWWSFLLRDLLWLALISDQISHLYEYDLIPVTFTILLSFAITLMFLFNVVMRYRAHRGRMFLQYELLKLADELEELRAGDERRHGIDWAHIPLTPLRAWSRKQ